MSPSEQPIGVFDSGIGGLTVLRRLLELLPNQHYVYLGDTARVPYGNKSTETVQRYSLECVDFLLEHKVQAIVVACNTASALALDTIRQHTSIPVVGMIGPAAAEALQASATGRIGVIGTRATIASNAYGSAIQGAALQRDDVSGNRNDKTRTVEVVSRACPLFVPLVEEGWTDTPATRMIAETYLQPLIQQRVDTLVLGCTHYPMLSELLLSVVHGVTLIDCGNAAARAVASLLAVEASTPTPLNASRIRDHVLMYLTDYTPAFQTIAKDFLGVPVEEPVRTVLRELS